MKRLIYGLVSIFLVACSGGNTSNTPASGDTTKYNLQNYSLTVGAQTNNCTLSGDSTLNCDSHGTFGGVYSVSFNTLANSPGAYVVMPPSGNTYGLNIAATGAGCDQVAPAGGVTYTCHFTIGASETAQAGNTLYLQINGGLGLATVVTINIT